MYFPLLPPDLSLQLVSEKAKGSTVKAKVSVGCLEWYSQRWRKAGKNSVILLITVLVNFAEKAVWEFEN